MKIGVVGAGISGLTLTAALGSRAPEIQVEVFERDSGVDNRFRGYGLRLNGDGGLLVLRSLGLYEQLARQGIILKSFSFCDQSGRVLLELPATGNQQGPTLHVKREALKTVLLGAIGGTPIHSGMLATGFRQNDRGVEVQFKNGQTASVDYLIACDGASSAIRRQMFGDQKRYLELTSILVDSPHPVQHPLLEGGYFMTLGRNGTSVSCSRQPVGVHLSYTVHAAAEDEISGLQAATLLRLIQHETMSWHKPIPEIVAGVDPASVVVRGYYDNEPLKRVRQGRVWLIGDAAHTMGPVQEQGANLAMVDALKLAKVLGNLTGDPAKDEARADALERDIVIRGRKAILKSRNASQRFHTTSHLQQGLRNLGFQVRNIFVGKVSRT